MLGLSIFYRFGSQVNTLVHSSVWIGDVWQNGFNMMTFNLTLKHCTKLRTIFVHPPGQQVSTSCSELQQINTCECLWDGNNITQETSLASMLTLAASGSLKSAGFIHWGHTSPCNSCWDISHWTRVPKQTNRPKLPCLQPQFEYGYYYVSLIFHFYKSQLGAGS